MQYSKIRLAYRFVIDQQSVLVWDKYVFEDTYREYLMQCQLFEAKDLPAPTFRELLAQNDKAQQLHYLVGIAADSYVQQLKGRLYRLTDVLGKHAFPFVNYELDIINSAVADKSKHKIGMTFYSPVLTLVDILDHCYLISTDTQNTDQLQTMMFPMQPYLAVCYVEK